MNTGRLQPYDEYLNRLWGHDYRNPSTYLITARVAGRRQLLGRVAANGDEATMILSSLGEAVEQALLALPDRCPFVILHDYQIMPDHVHFILQVRSQLPETMDLFGVYSLWVTDCQRAHSESDMLFVPGLYEEQLAGRQSREEAARYILDNPNRTLLRQRHADRFAIRFGVQVGGRTMDAVGNLDLLNTYSTAVHCRRHWTLEQAKEYTTFCLAQASAGLGLVGAFISEQERAILQGAIQMGGPVIRLTPHRLPSPFHPTHDEFYHCAAGLMLTLDPWPDHPYSSHITRDQCNALNIMAEDIANLSRRSHQARMAG